MAHAPWQAHGRNGLYLHLGRERAPSELASSVELGDELWAAAHALIEHRMREAGIRVATSQMPSIWMDRPQHVG